MPQKAAHALQWSPEEPEALGRAIAVRLAAHQFDVAVAYVGDTDLAEATVGEIKAQGRRPAAFAADISDEDRRHLRFSTAIQDRIGHVDVVVHTAGIDRPRPGRP